MGLFKKLGLPNADELDDTVRRNVRSNPLKNNPVTGAVKASQLLRAGKLGRMPIPGETTLMLRPGKLRLTYQERGIGGLGVTNLYEPPKPPGLEVRATGGGDALPLDWIPGTNASRNGFTNTVKALLAEVHIPATGEYTISAPEPVPDVQVLDGTRERKNPQLLLDA